MCNEQGLPVTRRGKRLQDMLDLLLKEINLTQFPPPGNNVAGVLISTYEGMLQCISLCLLLYGLPTNGTYNHSAIPTLAAEFFPDLTAVEFTTTGCPKAVQIPNLIRQVTLMNKLKHDPEKFFVMELTIKSVFPCNVMDLTEDMDPLEDTGDVAYFKNHLSNKQVMRITCRKEGKKFKINEPDKTAQGTHGV